MLHPRLPGRVTPPLVAPVVPRVGERRQGGTRSLSTPTFPAVARLMPPVPVACQLGACPLQPDRRPDLVGLLTLLGLVVLGVACWWLVPWFMHVVKHQDCIGSGATNC